MRRNILDAVGNDYLDRANQLIYSISLRIEVNIWMDKNFSPMVMFLASDK